MMVISYFLYLLINMCVSLALFLWDNSMFDPNEEVSLHVSPGNQSSLTISVLNHSSALTETSFLTTLGQNRNYKLSSEV